MDRMYKKIKYIMLMIMYGIYMVRWYIEALFIPIIKKRGDEALEEFKYNSILKWARFTFKIIEADLRYEGIENIPDEACLFVGNHQSMLDIPALLLGANRVVGFVAKKELLSVPIIGKWIKICNSVALDREDPRDAVRVVKEAVEILKSGKSMAIYPEGTRAKDGNIQEFKAGSLKLAIRAKVPIVPVTIDGSYKAFELNSKFEKATIKVKYGKPIYTDNLTKEEQKELSKFIHDQIKDNLDKMRSE
ncbi:lysophospholipid acyltransferase family protein [Clostridium mediterraneense]|uniref:lysophospholipid acyltransferase family protein n=1 Tax=Clostridium mediterraneense TaxID=1805472 RepID=UPI000A0311F5|nr:lysophospholipid acyltransferase family protein [Clostridium mediterraneense]